MANRKGEEGKTHFRSDRIENINGQWFFRVREQKNLMGPYTTHDQAKKAAEAFAKDAQSGASSINTKSNQYLAKAFSLK